VWVWAVGREAAGQREGVDWIPACAGMTGVGVLDCGEIGSVEDADRLPPGDWAMGRW